MAFALNYILKKSFSTTARSAMEFKSPPLTEIKAIFKNYGSGTVELTKDDNYSKNGIYHLRLNNPEQKNALSGKMMCELNEISSQLEQMKNSENDVFRGLLISSSGEFFCSGGDLSTVSKIGTPEQGYMMTNLMHDSADRLSNLPGVISAVYIQGGAIGGGAELILWPDFRLAHPSKAKIAYVQARMGVVTGWGGGHRLVKLLGYRKALDYLTSTRKISVEEGLRDGLIDETVDSIENAVKWLENRVMKIDSSVLGAIKNICKHAENNDKNSASDFEKKAFAPLWGGPVNLKALSQNIKHR